MSIKEFRGAVFEEVDAWQRANFPDLRIVYQNAPDYDESEATAKPWADVELNFYAGTATSLGADAKGRHHGTLTLSLYHRKGEGTADTDDLLDSFSKHFRLKRIGGGLLKMPKYVQSNEFKGWYTGGVVVPCHFDENRG